MAGRYAGGVTTPEPAPLRRDAERNRARILNAAREVFTADPDATMTSVAQHAGVGVGTLYRRFPTREDLLTALYHADHRVYQDILDEALATADPWTAFCQYLQRLCEHQASGGMRGALTLTPTFSRQLEAQRQQLRNGMQTLIERAQQNGSLRPDITPEDLQPVIIASAAVVTATARVNPRAWRRALALTLDGFRAEGAHPLPEPPLTQRELFRVQRRQMNPGPQP
ncbi:TetR family transcriptional regulator [Deinococcus knuensis]|uniref:TetR family transcriptional regulator n=1 Tax=Deinococcus knuensis TaxID=1837380 RepID=A0ABQ2SRF1_9DEIO|nr:TetR family transcriptional regulator [Deinococcus knuensis]